MFSFTKKTTLTSHQCPRCHHKIPTDLAPGAYPGALSRMNNATEICSRCGRDEAMRDLMHLPPVPPDDWPVEWTLGDIL